MKSNRIMWGLTSLVVLITVAVTLGTMDSRSHETLIGHSLATPTPGGGYEDLSKYAVVDYDASLPANAKDREKRTLANQRYDREEWVLTNPHPDTGMVGRFDEDETPPPELIPDDESDLVIVGEIVNVSAHLSNDKSGIYSEFTIRVNQILKNDVSKQIGQGESVNADRAGGFVRYPNGQKVLYRHSELGLPRVGSEYVFFLTNDKRSPNYGILTLYEIRDNGLIQLDPERRFDEFKGANKLIFIEAIRNKIGRSSQPNHR